MSALGGLLFLPERCLGFQVIHDEFTGLEALAPVRRGHGHQHDLVQRLHQTNAVDHARVQHVKAGVGGVNHGLNRALGHAGVVLQFQRLDIARATGVAVTHRTHKAAYRTHPGVRTAQGRQLRAQVKVLGLDAHTGFLRHSFQPPVTGGKKATSAPAVKAAASSAITWFSAMRKARPGARASA